MTILRAVLRPAYLDRLTPVVQRRIGFLLAANVLVIAGVAALLLSDESGPPARRVSQAFPRLLDELRRFGPDAAPVVLAGLGLTGIIFAGTIDLSIGAIVVFAGTVFGVLYERGAPPGVCFAACWATAVALSGWNAALIRLLRIPAIILTLGGLSFYRGAALILADFALEDFGGQISVLGDAYHAPGRDAAGFILAGAVVLAVLWEAYGQAPRLWLAVGSSPEAHRLAGRSPAMATTSAFLVGGMFLGLAALVYTTNRLTIEPSRMAGGFELQVIGAVVLGGTNIFGGEGSYLGTVLGASFLHFVAQAMLYAGISEYWQTALEGAIILAVIGFDCATHRRQKLLEELR